MERVLDYPFDPEFLLRKKKKIRRTFAEADLPVEKRVAVLGGSTTDEVKDMLELFLMKEGVRPAFYQSEYGRYYEDLMFENPELDGFRPDIIYIHTTTANITRFPDPCDDESSVDRLLDEEFEKFRGLWEAAENRYGCQIIQNNFEPPHYRLFGNLDVSDHRGRTRFVNRLNARFAEHAARSPRLFINDINYLASWFGLMQWHDMHLWYTSKYAMGFRAIPHVAHSVASIINAAFGRSRKCLVLDLDNTLWGGVIGDDGIEGIRLGRELAESEAYHDFQLYVNELRKRGVILSVCSKNDEANAREGFAHPDSVLCVDDFAVFKANWDPKHENVRDIAETAQIGLDSLVFVDDNPAEREIVSSQLPQVAVPGIGSDIALFRSILDRSGLFETVSLSDDDLKRACYYSENAKRSQCKSRFEDYDDFLKSLEMHAKITEFDDISMDRITQLTNKTNQFNLTTRRYSRAEMESVARDPSYIGLYGRLADKFGDNGIVSVVLGRVASDGLHMDLWLMSCRVLKRQMEFAMLDALVRKAAEKGAGTIHGYYLKTPKNGMVAGLYGELGFEMVSQDDDGNSVWRFDIPDGYSPRNNVIKVSE